MEKYKKEMDEWKQKQLQNDSPLPEQGKLIDTNDCMKALKNDESDKSVEIEKVNIEEFSDGESLELEDEPPKKKGPKVRNMREKKMTRDYLKKKREAWRKKNKVDSEDEEINSYEKLDSESKDENTDEDHESDYESKDE